MRCVRAKKGQAEIEVVDGPEPDGDGVLVTVRSAGICGSDHHLIDAQMVSHTLGHEFAGIAEDGTPVAVEPLDPCLECDPCRGGDYHLCRSGIPTIIGVGKDGGMAERVRVPARSLVPLPAGLRVEDASLVEPVAISGHGVRRAGVTPADRVLIVGAGTIGLTTVACARAVGAEVDILARHDHQRAAAARLGAGTDPSGTYSVVVDAAGSPAAIEEVLKWARPGGRLLLVATYWDGQLQLPAFQVCMTEIDVIPSSFYNRTAAGRDVDAAAALLATRPEIAETLITHRFPLDAAAEAFRVSNDRKSGAIKVVLEP